MFPAVVLSPHHAGHERTEDISRQLRAWSVVVLVGTQQHAESDTAVTVNRYPLPLESQLRIETRTHDEPKLWNQDTSGAQPAEGDAP